MQVFLAVTLFWPWAILASMMPSFALAYKLELVSTTDLRTMTSTTSTMETTTATTMEKPMSLAHVNKNPASFRKLPSNTKRRHTCGTLEFGPKVTRRIQQLSQKKKRDSRKAPSSIIVDTYFHIVTDLDGTGDVNNTVFNEQIKVLNMSFNASGSVIQFRGILVQRLRINDAFFVDLNSIYLQLGKFRKGGLNALNVFVLPNLQSFNGEAVPWFSTGLVENDGVYMSSDSLPGGGDLAHDSGLALVHGVGHWLGLLHVYETSFSFFGSPCDPDNPNDYIADTNQMFYATPDGIGCAKQRDTCPSRPGLDPTNNFMDLGDEYDRTTREQCKTKFTPQQVARMEEIWLYYRVYREICASDEFRFTVLIRFDIYASSTSWNITYANGTLVHDSIPDVFGDEYDDTFDSGTLTFDICLSRQNYVFHIYDCCGTGIYAPGYYKLSVDGVQIAKGVHDFEYSKDIPFGPLNPSVTSKPATTRKPTRKPTRNPTRKPNRKPTRKPT